jgi:hypothetical protein
VLEAEAKKKGLTTTEKLLEQEVDAKIPEPTDVEIAAAYAVRLARNQFIIRALDVG